MANLHRLLLATALTLVASLAVASSASAAPGNGADVVRQTECFNDPGFRTLCIDAKYVQNSTETPSGNFSYHTNGKTAVTETREGGLCGRSNSSKLNHHYLYKDGVLHEEGNHLTGEVFFDPCYGLVPSDCTYRFDLHYANGQLQFDREEINCNP